MPSSRVEAGASPKPAAIFLDRDGVINRAIVRDGRPFAPLRPEEFEILPGVAAALGRLKAAGYALVVVTNQPDVARGAARREVIDAMHARILAELPIDEVRVCFHDKDDDCACRKPRPGMLLEPPDYAVDRSVIIGDRWRDVDAGRNAGCRVTIFIDYGYDEPLRQPPDVRVTSLAEAVDWILTHLGNA